TASAIVVSAGGIENVFGIDTGAIINDGGFQIVLSGGVSIDSFLTDPGIQIVSSGGLSDSATIFGGEQDIYGSATHAIVEGAIDSATLSAFTGFQIVFVGGAAMNAVFSSGGTGLVLSGGLMSNASIQSGGILSVLPGGAASSTSISNGGT